jgi:hypothetical protein
MALLVSPEATRYNAPTPASATFSSFNRSALRVNTPVPTAVLPWEPSPHPLLPWTPSPSAVFPSAPTPSAVWPSVPAPSAALYRAPEPIQFANPPELMQTADARATMMTEAAAPCLGSSTGLALLEPADAPTPMEIADTLSPSAAVENNSSAGLTMVPGLIQLVDTPAPTMQLANIDTPWTATPVPSNLSAPIQLADVLPVPRAPSPVSSISPPSIQFVESPALRTASPVSSIATVPMEFTDAAAPTPVATNVQATPPSPISSMLPALIQLTDISVPHVPRAASMDNEAAAPSPIMSMALDLINFSDTPAPMQIANTPTLRAAAKTLKSKRKPKVHSRRGLQSRLPVRQSSLPLPASICPSPRTTQMITEATDPYPDLSMSPAVSQLADTHTSMQSSDMPTPSAVAMGVEAAATSSSLHWGHIPMLAFAPVPIYLAYTSATNQNTDSPVPLQVTVAPFSAQVAHTPVLMDNTDVPTPTPTAVESVAASSGAERPALSVEPTTSVAEPASPSAAASIANAAVPTALVPDTESSAPNTAGGTESSAPNVGPAVLPAVQSIEIATGTAATVPAANPAELSPTLSVDPHAVPTATTMAAAVAIPALSIAEPETTIPSVEPPASIAEPPASIAEPPASIAEPPTSIAESPASIAEPVAVPAEFVVAPAVSSASTTASQSLTVPVAATEQLPTYQFLTPSKRTYEETILLGYFEGLEVEEDDDEAHVKRTNLSKEDA